MLAARIGWEKCAVHNRVPRRARGLHRFVSEDRAGKAVRERSDQWRKDFYPPTGEGGEGRRTVGGRYRRYLPITGELAVNSRCTGSRRTSAARPTQARCSTSRHHHRRLATLQWAKEDTPLVADCGRCVPCQPPEHLVKRAARSPDTSPGANATRSRLAGRTLRPDEQCITSRDCAGVPI
jgi:hypothetical protein